MSSSTYYDADGDAHHFSQWQIRLSSGIYGGSGSYDSGRRGDLTSHIISVSLSAGSDYYWRVRYRDASGSWSRWSEETRFTTRQAASNNAPDAPRNVSPADGAANNVSLVPTLESSDFSDQDSGDVQAASWWQIATISNNYSSPVDEISTISDLTKYTLPITLTSDTIYYWHVKHQDAWGEWSPYSSETSFHTNTNNPPGKPDASWPDNDTGVSRTPALSGSKFTDMDNDTQRASQWQVRKVSGNYGDLDSYDSGPVTDATDHTVITSLSTDTGYYWRARYQDSNGDWSLYSDEASFTAESALPSSTGVAAYWKFDENGGSVLYDNTANGNDGTISGAWWGGGKTGSALNFDGTDDYVLVDTADSLNSIKDAITLEAWVKGSADNSYGDGSDGPLVVADSEIYTLYPDTYPNGYNFTSVSIANGGVLTVPWESENPLIIKATETVIIEGALDISGGDGVSNITEFICICDGGTGRAGGGNGGAGDGAGAGVSKDGFGTGGGKAGPTADGSCGGGGGGAYGTQGGNGAVCGGDAGSVYGDAQLSTFQGGSGGGGGVGGSSGGGRIRLDYFKLLGSASDPNPGNINPAAGYTGTGGGVSFISKDDSFRLGATQGISGNTNFYGCINGLFINTLVNVTDRAHLALSYDRNAASNQLKLYVNNNVYSQTVSVEPINTNTNDIYIGKFFSGSLDEMVVYNTALDAGDIQSRYNAGGDGEFGNAPEQPVNLSPIEVSNLSLRPTLTASSFYDADNHAHKASRWQARKTSESYGGSSSYDLTSTSDLTSHIPSRTDALEAGFNYYWRVQYQDVTGAWSPWSQETKFDTRSNNAPDRPNNQEPTDGVGSQSLNPTLAASGFSDLDYYSGDTNEAHRASWWEIITKTDYDSISGSYTEGSAYSLYTTPLYQISNTTDLTRLTLEDTSLVSSKTYYWHVMYQDVAKAWSEYSDSFSFSTGGNNRPGQPANVAPVNGSPSESRTPILTASYFSDAEDTGDATAAQWQIATDTAFGSIVYDSGSVTTTSYAIGGDLRWPIIIQNNLIYTALSGHQVEITLSGNDIDFNEFQSDGSDVSFTRSDGVAAMYFWVRSWDSLNNAATLWVKLPTLAANEFTTIYLYNASATNESSFDDTMTKLSDTTLESCQGRWHFDDGNSPTDDDSGNNFDGTVSGGATWQGSDGGQWGSVSNQTFSSGNHLSFDGDNDQVNAGNHTELELTDNFSIEAWVKSTKTGGQIIGGYHTVGGGNWGYALWMMSSDGAFGMLQSNGNNWAYAYDDVSYEADGQWHHLVGVRKNGTAYIYVDGVLRPYTTTQAITFYGSGVDKVLIGSRGISSSSFGGEIDEFAIYDRVLSIEEIQAHYWRCKYVSGTQPSVTGVGNRVAVSGTPVIRHDLAATLTADTTHYWRARYQDSTGAWSDYSTKFSFTTVAGTGSAPGKPSNVSPAVSETGVVLRPTLTASAYNGSESSHALSRWQYRPESGIYGGSGSYNSGETANLTGHTLPASAALTPLAVYYWRVQYKGSNSVWSPYSDETYFTARSNQQPRQPTNQSPADDEADVIIPPALSADAFSDPDSPSDSSEYHRDSWWRIRQYNGDYNLPAYETSNTNDLTSLNVPAGELTVSMGYYWQVQYQDGGKDWSEWSDETSFTTSSNHRPDTPINLSPDNVSGQSNTLKLYASTFNDTDAGDVQAASQWQITVISGEYDNDTALVYDSGPVTGTSHQIATTISYGTTYYWRVRYQDDNDAWSFWSNEENNDAQFTTQFAVEPLGAVAYWNFEETGGSTAYDKIGSYDGTINGVGWSRSDGKYGNAIFLSGNSAGDYIYIPSNISVSGDISMEMWFYGRSTAYQYLMDTRQDEKSWWLATGYIADLEVPGDLHWWVEANDYSKRGVSLDGEYWRADEWNHLVITVNSAESNMYLNGGTLAGNYQSTGDGSTYTDIGDLVIGNKYSDHGIMGRAWNGGFDDIIIYDSVLTSSQVYDRFAKGRLTGNVTAPNRPSNVSPASTATNVSLRPTLEGSSFVDPHGESHKLSRWQIRKDGISYGDSSGSYELSSTSPQLAKYTLALADSLVPSTNYYWRVQYQNYTGDWSNYSVETSFKTRSNTAPDAPDNQSPVEISGVNRAPTLAADDFSDPDESSDSMEIQAASWWQIAAGTARNKTNGYYDLPVYEISNTTDLTAHTLPVSSALDSGIQYYWQVQYQDVAGAWSNFSDDKSFTTGTWKRPDTPTNQSPVAPNNTDISRSPTLTSSDFSVSPADTHDKSQWRVRLFSGSYGDTDSYVYSEAAGDLTNHTVNTTLPADTAYYWQVRHKGVSSDWSDYSTETSFTTINAPVGAVGYWNFDESSGSTVYDQVLSNDGIFSGIPLRVSGKNSYGLSFDGIGTSDYVTITDNDGALTLGNQMSVEAWRMFPQKLSIFMLIKDYDNS